MTEKPNITFLVPKPSRRPLLQCVVLVPDNQIVSAKDIVCSLQFRDANEQQIASTVRGYIWSQELNSPFIYLPDVKDQHGLRSLPAFGYPETAASIQVKLINWNRKSDINIGSLRLFTHLVLPDFAGAILQEETNLEQGADSND